LAHDYNPCTFLPESTGIFLSAAGMWICSSNVQRFCSVKKLLTSSEKRRNDEKVKSIIEIIFPDIRERGISPPELNE